MKKYLNGAELPFGVPRRDEAAVRHIARVAVYHVQPGYSHVVGPIGRISERERVARVSQIPPKGIRDGRDEPDPIGQRRVPGGSPIRADVVQHGPGSRVSYEGPIGGCRIG